jgi:hypothetical protein
VPGSDIRTIAAVAASAACVGHLYQLMTVDFRADGSWSTYVCVRCGDERLVGPGEVHPQTV